MKTITLEAFEALAARSDWSREQGHEDADTIMRGIEVWEDDDDHPSLIKVPHTHGYAQLTSTLGDIKITYSEGYNYDLYDPESFVAGTEGMDTVWTVEGVSVVDEDGDAVEAHHLADYLPEAFSTLDYSTINMAAQQKPEGYDVDESADMKTITLEICNEPNIRFTGELIGEASSTDDRARGSFSGQTGRWTELALYKTIGGKFVCHQIGRTRWDGERDRFSGKVCETLDEVIAFFGHRWLAKELYEDAGIDDAVDADASTDAVDLERWADTTGTSEVIAVAIHRVAASGDRGADAIWADPTETEMAAVTTEAQRMIDSGDYEAADDNTYHWGLESVELKPKPSKEAAPGM